MSSVPPPPTSPPPPGSVGTPWTSPPSATPIPRKALSRPMLLVVTTVVVVVIVVLALLLVGIIPGLHTSSSSGGVTFSTTSEQSAASTAASYASGVSGGPWSLVDASGVDTTTTMNSSVAALGFGNSSCPLTGSKVTNLVVPGYNGTYSNGLAEAWLMALASSTGTGAGLFLFVQNGAVEDIGEINAPGCVTGPLVAPLPGGLIDSPAAAQKAVATANGTRYVDAYARSNATYALANAGGGGSPVIPVWEIFFYACSGGNESSFGAGIYATNGTVVSTDFESSPSSQCGGKVSPPLGTNFAWGTPINTTGISQVGCASTVGHYCYSIEIAGAGQGISTSNIQLALRNSAGAILPWPSVTISLVTPTSAAAVATYSTATGSWSLVPPFDGTLTGGDSIVIYTGSTGAGEGLLGDQLVAIGVNGYSGSVASNAFS
jgi:hypothetical protein